MDVLWDLELEFSNFSFESIQRHLQHSIHDNFMIFITKKISATFLFSHPCMNIMKRAKQQEQKKNFKTIENNKKRKLTKWRWNNVAC